MAKKILVSDTETCILYNDEGKPIKTKVWAVGTYNVLKEKYVKSYSNLDEYMNFLFTKYKNSTVYFHNLAYDGTYILNWLGKHGYKPDDPNKRKKIPNTYKAIISNTNAFYSIEVVAGYDTDNKQWKTIKFLDSLKIIPKGVRDISKDFGIEETKGIIDYETWREDNHILTNEEDIYLQNDCIIVGKALKYFHDRSLLNGITIGSIAFKEYKALTPRFNNYFPKLDIKLDDFIRKSYKGGFTYCNPSTSNIIHGKGYVYDQNSMYPGIMRQEKMPYGKPIFFTGKPNPLKSQSYVVRVKIEFELKPNKIPCIQIKNNPSYKETEYLSSSNGDMIELTLTEIDLNLIQKQYQTTITYIDGYYFHMKTGLFNTYIDKWMDVKVQAELEGNKSLRYIAKLFLNNLYGKFGTNPKRISKIPEYDEENDIMTFTNGDIKEIKPVYIPIASFVTAYGREKVITAAQVFKDKNKFLYCDTDSIHILDYEGIESDLACIDIHPTDIGKWKEESIFSKSKFIRAKTYIEEINGKIEVKGAGMTPKIKEQITFENFVIGATFEGKLSRSIISGGTALIPTTFTIK